MRLLAFLIVIGATAPGISGCAGPAIVATAGFGALQTGTEAFVRGELEAAVAHPLPEVYAAVEAALKSLEFPIRSSKLGEFNAYVNSKETQGRKVDIDLQQKSPRVTKVNIRIGVFGDQAVSRLIMAAVQANLDAPKLKAPDSP